MAAALGASSVQAADPPVIHWQEADEHVGRRVTVQGQIVRTKDIGRITFLNFSQRRGDFVAVVFDVNYSRFPKPPERHYDGKRVRVTGVVKTYKGTPQIEVESPEQIETLEPESGQEPPLVSWREAPEHVGEKVRVEGRIVQTRQLDGIAFLNFGQDYEHQLSLVVFGDRFDRFGDEEPFARYRGEWVRVVGEVIRHEGRPQIVLKRPDQIRLLRDAERREAEARVARGAEEPPVISWQDADRHYGEEVVAEGSVVRTHHAGKVVYLNFHTNYKRYLTAVLFAEDLHQFPDAPEEHYRGKKVRVRGWVENYQGKPQIVLHSPDQIEIVE